MIAFTEWAIDILRRSDTAARRFDPDSRVRLLAGGSCTDGCGDQIACRVWVYREQEYTELPDQLGDMSSTHGTACQAAMTPDGSQ